MNELEMHSDSSGDPEAW